MLQLFGVAEIFKVGINSSSLTVGSYVRNLNVFSPIVAVRSGPWRLKSVPPLLLILPLPFIW